MFGSSVFPCRIVPANPDPGTSHIPLPVARQLSGFDALASFTLSFISLVVSFFDFSLIGL